MKRVSNVTRFVGMLCSLFLLVVAIDICLSSLIDSFIKAFVVGIFMFLLSFFPFYCLFKDWAAEVNWKRYSLIRLYREFKEFRKKKKMGLLD